MLLQLAILGVLLLLTYQDWRYRAVSWILFPLLSVLLFCLALGENSFSEVLFNTGINLTFVLSQLFLISVYFSIKKRRFIDITRVHLGWGDVLFLISISFCFSPINYIVFYTLSLVVIAMLTLIVMIRSKSKELKIPLAGLQALLLVIPLLLHFGKFGFSLSNDYWVLNHFIR